LVEHDEIQEFGNVLSNPSVKPVFTQDDIRNAAYHILDLHPDPIPTRILLAKILRLPEDNTEVQRSRESAIQSKWVQQLEATQQKDES
jgi:hypothetical protein